MLPLTPALSRRGRGKYVGTFPARGERIQNVITSRALRGVVIYDLDFFGKNK
jgi:hypothetical protein